MSFDQRSRGSMWDLQRETSRGCGFCTIECRFSNATTSNQPGASSRDKFLLLGISYTGLEFGDSANMPAVIVDAGLDNFETVLKVSASTPRLWSESPFAHRVCCNL